MLPICRHILTNGEQCRSLRLTGQDFCYFHNRMHASHKATRESQPDRPLYNTEGEVVGYSRPVGFQPGRIPDLGLLEDRTAVQVAISTVVNALASDAMDIRRATALLYGLQLASNNCPPNRRDHSEANDPVESTVTENGTIMAPADRVPPAIQAKDDWLKEMQEIFDAEDAEEADAEEAEDEEAEDEEPGEADEREEDEEDYED